MDRVKLLQNPLPVDRVAARVVKKAKPEHLWRPMPKMAPHLLQPGQVLATVPLPDAARKANPALKSVIGSRRDRFVVLGYSALQGSKKQGSKWVVKCDCGNHEHRTHILRWLGTQAPDMCRECRNRAYKLRGGAAVPALPKAKRATAP